MKATYSKKRSRRLIIMYHKIYQYKNLYEAYKKSRRNVTKKKAVLKFEYKLEENLIDLQKKLKNQSYKQGEYREFTLFEPKERLVKSLPFKDRVVQQAVYKIIEPVFEKSFIKNSYACRKNKGTHKALKELHKAIKNQGFKNHALKADIKKYFHSIDHELLINILRQKIKCKKTLRLLIQIIKSHHSFVGKNKGIPIGNLLSQIFANIYLTKLDQFITRQLQIKNYFRYMDDFIILGNKKELHITKSKIKKYLKTIKLELHLKKQTIIKQNYVDFVGYQITPNQIKIRRKNLNTFIRKLSKLQEGKKRKQLMASWKGYTKDRKSVV